jgi:hypothetical protein
LHALQTSSRRSGKLSSARDAPQRQQTRECGIENPDVTYAEAIDQSYRPLYWGFYFGLQQYCDCSPTVFAD